MVERLKEAIEKARRQRDGALEAVDDLALAHRPRPAPPTESDQLWEALPIEEPGPEALEVARIVADRNAEPAAAAFGVLRTRIMATFREKGWTRLAVSSPTKGCGKSMISANLAFSIARSPDHRVALLDLDLRNPTLGRMLRITPRESIHSYLSGEASLERTLVRVQERLAVGLAERQMRDGTDLLQSAAAAAALAALQSRLTPTLTIYDLPPIFAGDDVLALLPCVDAVLLVAGAGETRARHIETCVRLVEGGAAFLGVVLNKVEVIEAESYYGGY